MKKYVLLIFLICTCALNIMAQETSADVAEQPSADTIRIEKTIRDTVIINIKPKTDTIYVTEDSLKILQWKARRDSSNKATSDSSFSLSSVYLGLNFFHLAATIIKYPAYEISIEKTLGKRQSLRLLHSLIYINDEDFSNKYGDDFKGDIFQWTAGAAYRHYRKSSILSGYIEFGLQYVSRTGDYTELDYVYEWNDDARDYVKKDLSKEIHQKAQGYQWFVNLGMENRKRAFEHLFTDISFGIGYNVLSNWEKGVLYEFGSIISDDLQFNLNVIIGWGL